jgi:hypothetical protein
MNLKLIFLACFLGLSTLANSQVDDIRKKSEENKKQHGNNKKERSGGSGKVSDDLAEGCVEACAATCFQIVGEAIWSGLVVHHNYMMDSVNYDPTVFCFDIMPHFAYNPDKKYINALPRVRGTWGVLSTDFRYNYLAEKVNSRYIDYQAVEWQVLQLNFTKIPVFNFRIGTGFYYDLFAKQIYSESSVAIGLRFNDFKLMTDLEGRYAPDALTEINFRLSYRLLQTKAMNMYLVFGVLNQNYFSSVNLTSVQCGLTFNLH